MKRNQSVKKEIHHSVILILLISVMFTNCGNNKSTTAENPVKPPMTEVIIPDMEPATEPAISEPLIIPPTSNLDLNISDSHSVPDIYDGYFKVVSPDSMQKDVTYEFRVEMIKDSIKNSDFFNEVVAENQNITIEDIQLGRYMSVELQDLSDPENNNFYIKRLSSEIQPIEDQNITSWLWGITPKKSGVHTLVIIAKIKIFDEKAQKYRNRRDVEVKRKKIHVSVKKDESYSKRIIEDKKTANNYYGLFALLLLPILGIIIWLMRRKKKEQKEIPLIPLKEFNEFQSNFQELIAKDRIDKSFAALKDLLKKYKYEKLEKELILLESNYQNNANRHNSNLIDNEDFSMNRSKVINELIAMANRLKREE